MSSLITLIRVTKFQRLNLPSTSVFYLKKFVLYVVGIKKKSNFHIFRACFYKNNNNKKTRTMGILYNKKCTLFYISLYRAVKKRKIVKILRSMSWLFFFTNKTKFYKLNLNNLYLNLYFFYVIKVLRWSILFAI